jgi:large subunit ribosomal protein L2
MYKYINYIFFDLNKKTSIGIRPKSGRNFSGKICVYHKSGGLRNKYFFIDFYRRIHNFGYIYKILKCTNRSAFISGIIYENGLFCYHILTETLKLGSKIYSGNNNNNNKIGNSIIVNNINLFTIINNIEKYPFFGGSIARSAGTSALLTSKINKKIILKLKSG